MQKSEATMTPQEHAQHIVHLLLDAQREWPSVTDCDRLDRAFADLNGRGIVARQNFACCKLAPDFHLGKRPGLLAIARDVKLHARGI